MFNWVFFKKFILAGSVAGLSTTPLFLISKYSAWGKNQYFSEFKKRRGAYSLRFAERFGFDEFTREIFNVDQMKAPIEGVFARDIVGNYLRKTNSSYLRNKYSEFASKEAKDFERELADLTKRHPTGKPAINRILDENGGTREDMIRRKLNNSSYDFLKKEILEFDQNNFTLNRHYDPNKSNTSFIRDSHFFSKSELEDSKNWSKIGFYPLVTRNVINNPSLEHFQKDKFDFINWAYKKWFEEVQPFYVWMSLWKYKENATRSELETVWNKSLGADFPSKASYEFPYFDETDGSKLSTASKFEKFFDTVIKNSQSKPNKDLYVPNLYTDDSGTALYMEASNMYDGSWFVKFAAAANYKYQKELLNEGHDKYINEKDKNSHGSHRHKLFEFFANSNSRTLAVDKSNIFGNGNGNGEKYADAVEIRESPWIFIRNQAGIHAIAVDSAGVRRNDGTSPKLEDIYHHFNFRTLQVKEKKTFSLQETLGIDYTKPINSFKEYVSKHFDRLLVSYTVSDSSRNNNLFRNYNIDISNRFKNLFNEWEELVRTKARYQRSLQLREALIKEYARSNWDTDTGKEIKNFKNVPKKMGIASPLPYELKLTRGNGKDEEYLFPELEKIYGVYFDGIRSEGVTYSSNLNENVFLKSIKEKQEKFQKTLVSSLGKLELNTKVSGYFQSDRIFLNNFYVNEIIDIFFKNENLFRNLLLKSSLKEDYLGKSFIGNKGYVDVQIGKTLLINGKSADADAKEDDFLDFDSKEENLKKLMKDIETYVNKFYYGKYFLKNIENNIWDVLKYGGGTIDSSHKKIGESIRHASKNAFENGYFLNVDNLKDKHLKFLATLTYLTRDKFKYFLSLMSATVTPKTDAYFLWERLRKKDKKDYTLKSNTGLLSNPWLNPEEQKFTGEVYDFNSYLNSYFSSYGKRMPVGSAPATQATAHYKGFLVVNSPQTWTKNLVSDPSKFVSNGLYKYGTENEVDTYVQSIQNEADLEEVIEKIKAVADKSKQNELNLLNSKTIYISDSGTSSSSSYRILTLQERKSLVSAILNKIKTEDIKDGKVTKVQYKKIFKTDPDKNWSPDENTRHSKCTNGGGGGGGCSELIKDYHYKPKKGEVGDYFVSQVNHNTFKNFDNLKKYVHEHLTKELFWAWIIDAAQNERVQEMAIRDLEDTITKVEAYDKQFQESASYRYAK